MKIYVYDSITGIYLGEDFCDDAFLAEDGHALPECTTTVAPPHYQKGEVPVFDSAANVWKLQRPAGGSSVHSYREHTAEPVSAS